MKNKRTLRRVRAYVNLCTTPRSGKESAGGAEDRRPPFVEKIFPTGNFGGKAAKEEVMAGARQPTDLVKEKGRKHLSRAEEEERRDRELRLPAAQRAKPPKWLPKERAGDFRDLGKKLIAVGLYTDLDSDTLGRYLVAQHQWVQATEQVQQALDSEDLAQAGSWGKIQDRYFKQARGCASDMGLTITSRCRLVLPGGGSNHEEEDEDEFTRILRQRQASMGK